MGELVKDKLVELVVEDTPTPVEKATTNDNATNSDSSEVAESTEGEKAATESPAETTSDKDLVFDSKAFEAITGRKFEEDAPPKEKPAEKPAEKAAPVPEKPPVAATEKPREESTAQVPSGVQTRADTASTQEFDATEQVLFKRMANDAREYFQDKLRVLKKQHKELEETRTKYKEVEEKLSKTGQLPSSWYENENAYVLDPNYQAAQEVSNIAKWALDHYIDQLRKIKEGQEWEDLQQDPQSGAISTVKKQPSVADEVLVTQRINNANIYYQNQQNQLAGLKVTFQNRVKDAFVNMRKVEDEYFPQYSDDKKIKENKHIQTMMDVLKTRSLDRSILSGFLAKLYAFSQEQSEEIGRLKAEADKAKAVSTIAAKTEPTASKIVGTASKANSPTVEELMEKYERIKQGLPY